MAARPKPAWNINKRRHFHIINNLAVLEIVYTYNMWQIKVNTLQVYYEYGYGHTYLQLREYLLMTMGMLITGTGTVRTYEYRHNTYVQVQV